MEVVALIVSHLIALAVGFVFGKVKGFNDAQPSRDSKGRFLKKD